MVEAAQVQTAQIVKFDDVWSKAVAEWKQLSANAAAYVDEFGAAYQAAHNSYNEFAACAHALTTMITPYNFTKEFSAAFVDKGGVIEHGGNGLHYLSDRGPGWKLREDAAVEARAPQPFIGTLDYWAAALVDPEFKQVCRKLAKLSDVLSDSSLYSRLGMIDMLEPAVLSVDTPLTRMDFAVGFGISLSSDPEIKDSKLRYVGALHRLRKELGRRFEGLMQDPAKWSAIMLARDCFYKVYTDNRRHAAVQSETMRNLYQGQPIWGFDVQAKYLRELAYVKMLGHREIAIEPPPMVTVTPTLQDGVWELVRGATYANGFPAPRYGDDKNYPAVTRALDRVLAEAGVVPKADLPRLDEETVSDKVLNHFVYDRTHMTGRWSVSDFTENPEWVSDRVKTVMRNFTATARAEAGVVSPQP